MRPEDKPRQYFIKELEFVPALSGGITKFERKGSTSFSGFGELYISEIEYPAFRGWKTHTKAQCTLLVLKGQVSFHLVTERFGCETLVFDSFDVDRRSLVIPAGVTFGFKAATEAGAAIANLSSEPHSPLEVVRPALDFHECEWTV